MPSISKKTRKSTKPSASSGCNHDKDSKGERKNELRNGNVNNEITAKGKKNKAGKLKRNRTDMELHADDKDKEESSPTDDSSKAAHSKRVRTIESSTGSSSGKPKSTDNALVKYECAPPKPPSSLTIEALLSVPLSFIFRQTNSNNSKSNKNSTQSNQNFLLSRVEATLLLQISQLAHEMDTLTSMTLQALDKSRVVRDLNQSIRRIGPNINHEGPGTTDDGLHTFYLRAIEPLLRTHGLTIPQRVLQHVQVETERILGNELPSLGRTLRQFSEQNWCVANTLSETMGGISGMMTYDDDDDGGTVGRLEREKRAVSELEEEVCRRIDGLVRMGGSGAPFPSRLADDAEEETGDAFETAVDRRTGEFLSMEDFCSGLLDTSTALVACGHGVNNDSDDDGSNGSLEGSGMEIPNVCSSIGDEKVGFFAERDGIDGPPCTALKNRSVVANHSDDSGQNGELGTGSRVQKLKEGSKSVDSDPGRPILMQSDPNCNGTGLLSEQHAGDDDDDHHQCNETQAIPKATSDSLDDAATALGLLSSGKILDRVTSLDSEGLI